MLGPGYDSMDLQQAFATFLRSAAGVRADSLLVPERRSRRGRAAAPAPCLSRRPLRRVRAARAGRPLAPRGLPHGRVLPPGAAAGGGSRSARHEGDPVRRGQLPVGIGTGSGGGREPAVRQPGDGAVAAHGGGSPTSDTGAPTPAVRCWTATSAPSSAATGRRAAPSIPSRCACWRRCHTTSCASTSRPAAGPP